jgi:hypothetical protein
MLNIGQVKGAFARSAELDDEDESNVFESGVRSEVLTEVMSEIACIEQLSIAAVSDARTPLPFDYGLINTLRGIFNGGPLMNRMNWKLLHNELVDLMREAEFMMDAVIVANEAEKEKEEREAAEHTCETATEGGGFFSRKKEWPELGGTFNMPAGHYCFSPRVLAAVLAPEKGIRVSRALPIEEPAPYRNLMLQ